MNTPNSWDEALDEILKRYQLDVVAQLHDGVVLDYDRDVYHIKTK